MNECNEQEETQMSEVSETKKKSEGKVLKNEEKQEVFISQSNL